MLRYLGVVTTLPVLPNILIFVTYSENPKVLLAVSPVFICPFQQWLIKAVVTASISPKPVAVINTLCNTKVHTGGLWNFMHQTPLNIAHKNLIVGK